MSSTKDSELCLEDITDIDTTLLTLRKPTDLKKLVDSVPRPERAVPKNGLPVWYRLGLECKLPVPKMPHGKVIFSRGKIGEDVRRLGLGSGPSPNFDLNDPYCHNVSYEYVPMHDPHLNHHFAQRPARCRMKQLGFVTKDGRAVCSLRDFNQYRKYLYNQFMDRIHVEMRKLDERAKDDLTLKRVEVDVARRLQIFTRSERAREHLERVVKEHADDWAEKKRLAKEHEMKVKARMKYLATFNEKQRKERAAKAAEVQKRIKQRVQAAAEIELRRKIGMIRQWRANEKKRLLRMRREKEAMQKFKEDEAERKWILRVKSQNRKSEEEQMLLKLYTDDISAGARKRAIKANVQAYNTDLELQRIRLANLKLIHGEKSKAANLVRKMGVQFEKSKRGAKGMSAKFAQELAAEAMKGACSTVGDPLMVLGQARARMDIVTVLPPTPVRLLEEVLEIAITELARRRVNLLLRDLERHVRSRAAAVFFRNLKNISPKKQKKPPRWALQVTTEQVKQYVSGELSFGEVVDIPADTTTELEMKSVRNRPPTPVPSKTKLAEVIFLDKIDDIPDPVAIGAYLPERKKLLEMVNAVARLLSRSVIQRVQDGMDIVTGSVTLPNMRHPMEWGEVVEGLASAVVDNRINSESRDIRRASVFLARRILSSLRAEMKEEKKRMKTRVDSSSENLQKDFYIPENMKGSSRVSVDLAS